MNRLIIPLLASAALAACQNNSTTNNVMAANDLNAVLPVDNTMGGMNNMMGNTAASATDTAFLTDAMKGDNSEVALGKIAADKGSSQGVKDLGNMLVSDHGAHKQQIAALAQQLGVPVTDDLKDEAKTEQSKLNGLSGDAFDTEFVRATIEDHKKDIAAYEQEANGTGPVAQMAQQTLPVLRKHLEAAQKLQQ